MKIDPTDMISQAEAARIRAVSHQAIVNLVKNGRLQTVEIGGKVFLSRAEVESYQKIRQGRPPGKKQTSGTKRARKSNAK